MSQVSLADAVATASTHLTDEEMTVASTYVDALEQRGVVSLEQAIRTVEDRHVDVSVRMMACRLVGWCREGSASQALARTVEESEDDGLAWEAANSLVRIRDRITASILLRVLNEGSTARQVTAAWVLGCLREADAIPSLRAAALNTRLAIEVRAHATEALGVMRASEAVPDLITLLSSESPDLRYWSAYSLGQIGSPESIAELERVAKTDAGVLTGDRSVREEARAALEAIRSRRGD